jgi:hypothetical protein
MKISTPNKIRAEDFKEEDRDIAEKLSGLNGFQDEVVNIINNGRIKKDV